MLYPYMILGDDVQVCHSQLIEEDGTKKVLVHFERPTENGFDSARCELPSYTWTWWEGSFSDKEIAGFEEFIEANAHLLYEFAQSGGLKIA